MSRTNSNTGNAPDSNPDEWIWVPHDDYICITGNTNKDPHVFNMNAADVADRLWQKTYQREAAFDFNDTTIDGGDRTNAVTVIAPVPRDSSYQTYLRLDSNKTLSYLTHFKWIASHTHEIQTSSEQGSITVPNYVTLIEIGMARNVTIEGNLRVPEDRDWETIHLKRVR